MRDVGIESRLVVADGVVTTIDIGLIRDLVVDNHSVDRLALERLAVGSVGVLNDPKVDIVTEYHVLQRSVRVINILERTVAIDIRSVARGDFPVSFTNDRRIAL